MPDSKKPDKSKKDAPTPEEEQAELSADELDQVAGGVINCGGAVGNLGKAVVLDVPKVPQIGFDPNIIPKGGTSE